MMLLNSARTHDKRVSVSAVEAADFFAAVLLTQFRLSSCGTSRIVPRVHPHCSSLSTPSAEAAIEALCRRSRHRTRSDDRDVLLSLVLFHCDLDRAFPTLFLDS